MRQYDSLVSLPQANNELKRRRSISFSEHEASFAESGNEGDLPDDSLELEQHHHCQSLRVISYRDQHKQDVVSAQERLNRNALAFPRRMKSLFSILAQESKVFHLAAHVMPRCLRLSRKSPKIGNSEEIWLSKSSAILKRELGRGAYGVVGLLQNPPGHGCTENIALKAQSPPDCLAWEYEILQSLRNRLKTCSGKIPFPIPFSYLGLEDGAMFTMSAASESGLTLLDLVNNYKSVDHVGGNSMPEILAIHYTARMLHHIELLHSRGKILVRDLDHAGLAGYQCNFGWLLSNDVVL